MAPPIPFRRPFRPRRRRFSAAEIRLTILGGLLLGLTLANAPAVWADRQPLPTELAWSETQDVRVVDGDTFWFGDDKIRIADIDTPETHPPRCAHEAALGERATRRLDALLADGDFALARIDRDTDRYGRKLRIVTRGGRSIGDTLIAEGLARPYGDGRRAWCV